MKKLNLIFFMITLLLLAISGCSSNEQSKDEKKQKEVSEKKVELTMSAAASLQDALTEIQKNFENDHPNIKVNYNFGSSGSLQQQISQGAPVDLFFSAAVDKFEELVEEGLIEKNNQINLVGNELVLVIPNDSTNRIKSFEDLSKTNKISIGTPESVPAGKYAKESLEKLNVWNSVEEKTVYAKDVRQVLTYVETNNVDAGIVYKTDAIISPKVRVIATAEEKTHEPIIYPLGIMNGSPYPKEAKLVYDYLQSENSMKTFEKYGFKRLK